MARESQGLQVVLIIFVMLCVVLGVSLYLYVKEADTATKAVEAAKLAAQQVESDKKATEEENKVLKTLIGFPEKSVPEIKKQFDEDMQTYGNQRKSEAATDTANADKPLFDPGALYYSRLLAGMYKVIQERTDELLHAKADLADLQKLLKNHEAAKAEQINTLLAGYGTLEGRLEKIAGNYQHGQQATETEIAEITKAMAVVKKNAMDAVTKATDDVKALQIDLQAKERKIAELTARIKKLEGPEAAVPPGEITAVSLANKLVTINRGRADAWLPKMQFTVYSADSINQPKAVPKARVEVIRIVDEHSAEARIVDEKIADPILVGDKVSAR